MRKTTPAIFFLSIILILGASLPSWAQRQRVTVGPGGGGGGRARVQVSPRQAPQRSSAPRVQSSPRVRQSVNVSRPSYRPSGSNRAVVNTRSRNEYRPSRDNRPSRTDYRPSGQYRTTPSSPTLTPGNEPFRYYNPGGSPRNGAAVPGQNVNNGRYTNPGQNGRYTNPGRYNNNSGQRVRVNNGRVPTTYSNAGYRVPVNRPSNRPVYTQPVVNNNYYYSNRTYRPRYNNWANNNWANPYFYSNYNYRRGFRYYQPCAVPFLSLGFFAVRPYSYYDYARVSYAQPFVYGDDAYYRSSPLLEGGTAADSSVASTAPTAPVQSLEQELLGEISNYVDSNSKEGRFQLKDPAFGNQVWSLDLTEAPAVYSLDTNHYTVVAGFEGTLGENSVPSAVGLEFFVERENGRWNVKQSWIVSANGIPRAKRFQSPTYPQVQTWQEGAVCPFTGKPMVPVTESSAQQHG